MSGRKLLVGAGVLGIALVAWVLASRSTVGVDAAERFDLSLRLAAGARAAIQVAETTQSTLRYDGRRRQVSTETRELKLELSGIEGAASPQVNDVRLAITSYAFVDDDPLHPARGEGTLDALGNSTASTALATAREPRIAHLESLLGATSTTMHAPPGTPDATPLESGDPTAARLLGRLSGGRPRAPVRVGDEWHDESDVDVPGLGTVVVERHHRLTALESRGPRRLGVVTTELAGAMRATAADADVIYPFELWRLSGKGERQIDLVNGLVIEGTLEVSTDVHGERGRLRTLYRARLSTHVLR